MNVDHILNTMNQHRVAYMLIGGMNFLLRHEPVLTYDVDLWIEDGADNLDRCEGALAELHAEWGETEANWKAVADRPPGWLRDQALFCLTSPHGSIDIFRSVKGLDVWAACRTRAVMASTSGGIAYPALSDADMLKSQLALPLGERRPERIRVLKETLELPSHE